MRKGSRRIVLATLIASIAIGMLTACGSGKVEASAENSTPEKNVRVIKAATSAIPRPFTYQDENNELTGHNIELIKAVFDRLPQYKLEIETTEFQSIFVGIDSGIYQLGVNNIAKNPEREEKYLYTDAEMKNHYIVVTNSEIKYDENGDLSQLAGKKYIGPAGNDKTTIVEKYNDENSDSQIEIEYTDADIQQYFEAVESGKADFFIMDEPVYKGYYAKEFNFQVNVARLDNIKSAAYSYFIVGKQDTQLAEDINKALKEVIADGTSKKISEKYLGDDYSPYDYEKEK